MCCYFLHLIQRLQRFFSAADVISYDFSEKVSGKAPLACIDQSESFLKLLFRFFRDLYLFYLQLLPDSGS